MMRFWDACNGISWTICKQSALCSRQITTTTPNHSIFTGRILFLMPNQQCQSTEGSWCLLLINIQLVTRYACTGSRPGMRACGCGFVRSVDTHRWSRDAAGGTSREHHPAWQPHSASTPRLSSRSTPLPSCRRGASSPGGAVVQAAPAH